MTQNVGFEMDRRRRSLRVKRSIALILVGVTLFTGCWKYDTPQNKWVSGNVWYFHYKRYARRDVVERLHYQLHKGDAEKTFSVMKSMIHAKALEDQRVRHGIRLSGFNRFFFKSEYGDFRGAAYNTAYKTRCLVQHYRSPVLPNRHNWTYRKSSDPHCTLGSPY